MKREFVKVKNVIRFIGGVEAVRDRTDGIESLMLAMGTRGSGKTRCALWLMAHDPEILYLRGKAAYEGRVGWFLRDLARELGLCPDRTIEGVYGQIIAAFQERSRIVIIDEIARLANSSRLLEIVKDIHDQAGIPFVFLGEIGVERLFSRFPSVLDRITQILIFAALDEEDIALIARNLLEIPIEDNGLDTFIGLTEKRFRAVVVGLHKIEKWGKNMGVEAISAEHVEGIFNTRSHRKAFASRSRKTAISAA